MRTYLILKEKVSQFNEDSEIQALLKEINADDGTYTYLGNGYSKEAVDKLKAVSFDRATLSSRKLPYEQLDQLTIELLLGVR